MAARRSIPILATLLVALAGCRGPERVESDDRLLGVLRPGLDPPGPLSTVGLPEHRIEIGLPQRWVVTIVREDYPGRGEWQTVTARGPRDSGGGLGCTELCLVIGRVVPALPTLDAFASERLLDHRVSREPAPPWTNTTLGGARARKVVLDDTKLVPPTSVEPTSVATRRTVIVAEKNGFLYDLSLAGTRADHDRHAALFESVVASVQFRE